MTDENKDTVRERAFAIWETQGHPEGLADTHWAQAQADSAGAAELEELPSPLATGAAAETMTGSKPGQS